MIISVQEIIDVIAMTVAVGYIFMDFFKMPPRRALHQNYSGGFDWSSFKFSCYVTAPAIIFHELLHKLVAIFFGLSATFHAAYGWLLLGIFLKMIGSTFIFFVPGYVSISSGFITPLQHSIIAFAGPATNGILYLLSHLIIKYKRKLSIKTQLLLHITKKINGLLFLFNMLPIPFFDGMQVYEGVYYTISRMF
ncbi:M50 family metallopeptidase [Candidatus Woesearchaeota archaeon]|nr:M50 family metallopeptidase [Candidatus Woesearchaeota archaeon]